MKKLGHLDQFCRTCVYFHFQFTYLVFANLFKVPIYVISVKNSMIAHTALVVKDTFAQRFASMQSILDSAEFLENYEVIFC